MVRPVAVSRRTARARVVMPATAISVAAPGANVALRVAVLSATAWLSARVLAIKLPNFSMPKLSLPKISLPNIGGNKEAPPKPRVPRANVKVRAASSDVATPDAPTLAELTGEVTGTSIGTAAGWKRFPSRRMPGANMDRWKEISKEITPKL